MKIIGYRTNIVLCVHVMNRTADKKCWGQLLYFVRLKKGGWLLEDNAVGHFCPMLVLKTI